MSSTEVLNLFNTVDDISELSTTAVKEIIEEKLSILELVEGLSTYLTSADEDKRRQGVLLLAKVLKDLPLNLLNLEETNGLSLFFCDRLKDRLTVVPSAIMGLEAVTSMDNIPDNVPFDIMQAFSMHITVQTLTQSSRLAYYATLESCMLNKTKVLLNHSTDFVFAVITAMDSESDPRCLMFLFKFLPYLFSQFPLNHLTEEAFSVLECYFPVDFNPKDQIGLTREDLAQGLQDCLLATPAFGQFIVPTILEKLDSQLKLAHLDALDLLIKGTEIWPVNVITTHISDIWKSLAKILLPPTDDEVSEMALQSILALITVLDKSDASCDALNGFMENISSSTHGYLSDPNLNLFIPSMNILSTVAYASKRSCEYVINRVSNQLFALLEKRAGGYVVLEALWPILRSSMKYDCWNSDSNKVCQLLRKIPGKLIDLLAGLKASNGCFLCLIEIIPHLTLDHRRKILKIILEYVNGGLTFLYSELCSNYLISVGIKYPEELKRNLLQKLNISGEALEIKHKLEIFCWCCNVLALTSFSVDKIFEHINKPLSSKGAIECLRELCEKADDEVLIAFGTECKVPERLITFALRNTNVTGKLEEDNIINISKSVQSIVRALDLNQQKELLSICMKQFIPPGSNVCPNLSDNQLFLLEGLVCPLRPKVATSMYDSLVNALIDSSINKGSARAREAASLILASIINKFEGNADKFPLETVLNSLQKGKQKEIITLLSWITKSLIMKGHVRANYFLDQLIAALAVRTVQMEAANGFKLILMDHESLSIKNFCTVKLLCKQRIFIKLNDIIKLLDGASGEDEIIILLVITYILQYVPKTLVISRISEIVKVLIQCMESDSQIVVNTCLKVICSLLESGDEILNDYVDTFLSRFLGCAQNSNSMNVRIDALTCIYYYGLFKEVHILPYREKVLHELEKCLDDKKRLVRQMAVRARHRWFLVGSLPE